MVLIIVVPTVIIVLAAMQDSCEIRHVALLDQIALLDDAFDPDSCYQLLERIDSFNQKCDVHVEILECG